LWTTIDKFPKGFRDCQIALRPKIFEASHTYRIMGSEQYLTIIEENGRRYYKAYLADRLDGPWKPIADTAEKPFAGWISFCGLFSATKLRVKPATQSNITFPPNTLRPCSEGVWGKSASTYLNSSGRSEPANHWPVSPAN
jgi:hypothetical protein